MTLSADASAAAEREGGGTHTSGSVRGWDEWRLAGLADVVSLAERAELGRAGVAMIVVECGLSRTGAEVVDYLEGCVWTGAGSAADNVGAGAGGAGVGGLAGQTVGHVAGVADSVEERELGWTHASVSS